MGPIIEHKSALPHYVFKRELTYPLHLHNYAELIYLDKGAVEVTVAGTVYEMRAGDFMAIFPNQIHAYKMLSQREDTACQIFNFEPAAAGRFEATLRNFRPGRPLVPGERVHRDVPYAFAGIRDMLGREGPDLVTPLFMQLILARTTPLMELTGKGTEVAHDLTARVVAYVSAHFREPLSLELLSKEFGVSRYHLSRIFTDTIQVGFCRYINAMRISAAKELLQNTNREVLDIGADCGFETQQTFNRVFKEMTGLTPKEYRRLYVYPAAAETAELRRRQY